MPFNLIRSDDYDRSVEGLSPSAKLALAEIEAGIQDNPDSYPGTNHPGHERHDYGVLVVVRSGSLMVSFARQGEWDILMLEVMDELSPPPWYLDE